MFAMADPPDLVESKHSEGDLILGISNILPASEDWNPHYLCRILPNNGMEINQW
jgi:hypothetical protein